MRPGCGEIDGKWAFINHLEGRAFFTCITRVCTYEVEEAELAYSEAVPPTHRRYFPSNALRAVRGQTLPRTSA